MKIIGITGPSGSGKTLLSEYFSEHGIACIDADRLYHSMLIPPSRCLDAIASAFGDKVLTSDGRLDRAALGSIVFGDAEKLELLNKTVLGIVIDEIRKLISEYSLKGHSVLVIDAPTLIESGFDTECDTVISVISSPEKRIERISERDVISKEKAKERIRAQHDDKFYISHSDIVLYNNGTVDEFSAQIAEKLGNLI